jgi:acyl-CoA reductase-like NAD-dependent aldehyde dehydrogenase
MQGWERTDVKIRQQALRNLAELIEKHGDKLAEVRFPLLFLSLFSLLIKSHFPFLSPLTLLIAILPHSSMRSLWASRSDSTRSSVATLAMAADLAGSALGESSILTPGTVSMTLRQPYGVTAGIVRLLFPVSPLATLSSPLSLGC